jgi:hypothetical protein
VSGRCIISKMIVLLYVTIKHIYRNILTLSRIVFAPCPVAWNLSCAHVWRLLRGHAAGHVAVAASARYRWRWGTGGTARCRSFEGQPCLTPSCQARHGRDTRNTVVTKGPSTKPMVPARQSDLSGRAALV